MVFIGRVGEAGYATITPTKVEWASEPTRSVGGKWFAEPKLNDAAEDYLAQTRIIAAAYSRAAASNPAVYARDLPEYSRYAEAENLYWSLIPDSMIAMARYDQRWGSERGERRRQQEAFEAKKRAIDETVAWEEPSERRRIALPRINPIKRRAESPQKELAESEVDKLIQFGPTPSSPPPPFPPGGVIRQGSARTGDVKKIQEALIRTGDLPANNSRGQSNADGLFGSSTGAAVSAFQGRAGLGKDGVVGPATWAALFASPGVAGFGDCVGMSPLAVALVGSGLGWALGGKVGGIAGGVAGWFIGSTQPKKKL